MTGLQRRWFIAIVCATRRNSASDHSAGLFWRSSGTSLAGDAMEYDGVSLLVFDDAGKITRFQGFFDSRRLSMKPAH